MSLLTVISTSSTKQKSSVTSVTPPVTHKMNENPSQAPTRVILVLHLLDQKIHILHFNL